MRWGDVRYRFAMAILVLYYFFVVAEFMDFMMNVREGTI
jgi:hypothetical protein